MTPKTTGKTIKERGRNHPNVIKIMVLDEWEQAEGMSTSGTVCSFS